MNDTPKTDAAILTEPHQVRELGFEVVKASDMAAVERKLNHVEDSLLITCAKVTEAYDMVRELRDNLRGFVSSDEEALAELIKLAPAYFPPKAFLDRHNMANAALTKADKLLL